MPLRHRQPDYLHALPLLLLCFARFEYNACAVFQSSSLTLAEFDENGGPSADSLAARPFDKSGVGLDATSTPGPFLNHDDIAGAVPSRFNAKKLQEEDEISPYLCS
ncbi:hypothetical protein V8C34DRAFT_303399 [Trichoderma compactum]